MEIIKENFQRLENHHHQKKQSAIVCPQFQKNWNLTAIKDASINSCHPVKQWKINDQNAIEIH